MKRLFFVAMLFFYTTVFAQHTPLPHGMVFGSRPNTLAMMEAGKLDVFMGNKPRITTTIRGVVTKVVKPKGGWFNIDAGGGRSIAAHFTNYNIVIPADLKGRTVIIEGVAQKPVISNQLQHFAGDTVVGKKQYNAKPISERNLTFEVKGLFVEK